MPIRLIPFQADQLCVGHKWEIIDRPKLVLIVAKVLLGKFRHAEIILNNLPLPSATNRNVTINKAIKILTLPLGADPWHRDGLIFQFFSWIAANIDANGNAVIRPPHLIPAQKGFDGLQISINHTAQTVDEIIIFEDKATDNPRTTIRKEVWPEFEEFYAAERDNEIEQEITLLIKSAMPLIADIDQTIEKIFWEEAKKFRISITANQSHDTERGRKRLFKGYDNVIPQGDVNYRNAQYIHIPNLRVWMESFSQDVVSLLESWKV